jgi:hypothetical protein
MLWLAHCRGWGEERGAGVGYCCKWVLTVSNSGGELGVKVLCCVGPAQGQEGELGGGGGDHGCHPVDQSLCRTNPRPSRPRRAAIGLPTKTFT